MTLRLTWKRVLLGLATLLLGGMLVGWSGVINIGASGGHWAVTEWFLHWVMRNSVRTHALGIAAPPLDDPALLHRGAGHYATGCAPCHGAPGERQNPIVQASLPPPPDFGRALDAWTPEQLFRIVQHGVRYSGMPAWVEPGRHDEIWAMVAFLQALPRMEAERYRDLAFGAAAGRQPGSGVAGGESLAAPLQDMLADCARCHGVDGRGRENEAFPILAGQSEAYLHDTLRAFSEGRRRSGMMQPPAARADEAALRALAAHFAAQAPAVPATAAPSREAAPGLLAEGGRIAREGLPAEGVPACLSCHGAAALARNPAWPRLDGQHAAYLENQLRLWRQAAPRGGGPHGPVMETIGRRLPAEAARAVSAWFAARAPGSP
ncbi:c-type cytochrome [Pseudoroseomonas sp. WGS1072]|uniref:c-type cytochrome n=1 Tax=Roseomonas sp. WGS1072 TaxID=3366816 RepID=UPI003BEF6BA7